MYLQSNTLRMPAIVAFRKNHWEMPRNVGVEHILWRAVAQAGLALSTWALASTKQEGLVGNGGSVAHM